MLSAKSILGGRVALTILLGIDMGGGDGDGWWWVSCWTQEGVGEMRVVAAKAKTVPSETRRMWLLGPLGR